MREAGKMARQLARRRLPWASPFASGLRAGISLLQGTRQDAAAHWEAAIQGFEAGRASHERRDRQAASGRAGRRHAWPGPSRLRQHLVPRRRHPRSDPATRASSLARSHRHDGREVASRASSRQRATDGRDGRPWGPCLARPTMAAYWFDVNGTVLVEGYAGKTLDVTAGRARAGRRTRARNDEDQRDRSSQRLGKADDGSMSQPTGLRDPAGAVRGRRAIADGGLVGSDPRGIVYRTVADRGREVAFVRDTDELIGGTENARSRWRTTSREAIRGTKARWCQDLVGIAHDV